MRSPAFRIFVVVLVIGALLQGVVLRALGLSPGEFWVGLVALALVLGAVSQSAGGGVGRRSGGFLCDTCRYNDARYCSLPERPNATRCEDYRGRSGEE